MSWKRGTSNRDLFIAFTIGIVIGEALTAPFTNGFSVGDVAGAVYWVAATLAAQSWFGRLEA